MDTSELGKKRRLYFWGIILTAIPTCTFIVFLMLLHRREQAIGIITSISLFAFVFSYLMVYTFKIFDKE